MNQIKRLKFENPNLDHIQYIYPHVFLDEQHQFKYQIACNQIKNHFQSSKFNILQNHLFQNTSSFQDQGIKNLNTKISLIQNLQLGQLRQLQDARSSLDQQKPILQKQENQNSEVHNPSNQIQQETLSDDSYEQMTFFYDPKLQNSKYLRNNFDFQNTFDNLKRRFQDLIKNNSDENQSKSNKSVLFIQREKTYEMLCQELQEYEIQSEKTIKAYYEKIKMLNSIQAESRILRKKMKKNGQNELLDKLNDFIKIVVRQLCRYRNIITARESRLKKKRKHVYQKNKVNSIEYLIESMKSIYQDVLKDKPDKLMLILQKIDEQKNQISFLEQDQTSDFPKKYQRITDKTSIQ